MVRGDSGDSSNCVISVMNAGEMDRFCDCLRYSKGVGDFVGFGSVGDFDGIRVFLVIDAVVARGLVATDISFGASVIVEIFVDVEVVGFDSADDGDMGRFLEIPELKAGHFVNYDRFGGELV